MVNETDAAIVQWAFGSHAGDPDWNPDADLDNNGVINMADAGIVASAFHQHATAHWNQHADIDNNRQINILDITLIALAWQRAYLWDPSVSINCQTHL